MKFRIILFAIMLLSLHQTAFSQLLYSDDWKPDTLNGFENKTLVFSDDYDGKVTATLIRKFSEEPTTKAVLYVHGFVDYFFQEELADQYVNNGYNFYAIDLRKHGRSLLPHQHPNFMFSVNEFYADLDAAINIIKEVDGNEKLLLNAHSTGGLITALYMADKGSNPFDAVVYNSPFFDISDAFININERILIPSFLKGIASLIPYGDTTMRIAVQYGQSLHISERGEWNYDTNLKPIQSFPIYWGWLKGIMDAQQRLQAGLKLEVPILVMYSRKSSTPFLNFWKDKFKRTDIILDVSDINRISDVLGYHVNEIQIKDGVHDLTLSRQDVRSKVYQHMMNWSNSHIK